MPILDQPDTVLDQSDTVEIKDLIDNTENEKLTSWENEPTLTDLKQDYTDAKSSHTTHVNNVERWLDNLNITGKTKRVPKTN